MIPTFFLFFWIYIIPAIAIVLKKSNEKIWDKIEEKISGDC